MPVNPDQMNRMKARHAAIPKAVARPYSRFCNLPPRDIVEEMKRECPVSKDRAHGNPQGALRDSITVHRWRQIHARLLSSRAVSKSCLTTRC